MSDEGVSELERARADLAYTVGALEGKLNVPKQVRRARIVAADRMRELRAERPVVLVAAAAATVLAVGTAGLVVVRLATRR